MRNRTERWRPLLAASALVLAGPSAAWGWGSNGHRVVGAIAERHLTGPTLREIAAILDGESLAEASTWPDDIKSDPAWDDARIWHYISIDDGETLANTGRDPDGDVLEAMQRFEAVLRDPQAPKQAKAEALRFYVHFVGDVHQPLHVGRRDDAGGNTIKVLWFGDERRLHSVWDEGLIESENLSFTEFARFIADPTPAEVAALQAAPYEEWIRESFCIRPEVYDFGAPTPTAPAGLPSLGYAYAYRHKSLVERRLLAAGVRLAGRLEAIFAGTASPPAAQIPATAAEWCGE